jgi:SAM-dependent methyltransferase
MSEPKPVIHRARGLVRAGVLRGLRKLPPPRDEAAIQAAFAVRSLLTGRAMPARRPAGWTALRGSSAPGSSGPGSSVVRPPTGLPKAAALPADQIWQLPAEIQGSGHRVRSLYATGAGPKVYDVELLDALNAEYADSPLVPSPPSYSAEALASAAQRRVGWVHGMVGLAGQRTLEIGCGNGFEVWSLAHNLGCDAYGVDVSHYRPWDQLAGDRVHFECADLSVQNPYPRDYFDRVLSFTVWEHVTHPYAMLKATWDVLKPGGVAWIRANLYAGPQASHRYRQINFPWPHLLFSDQVVRDWDVAHGREPIGNAWVNRLSWLHYEYYADLLGFEVAHRSFTETPIDEDFYRRFEDILGRYPRTDLTRDYLLLVLQKPLI